MDGKIGKFGGMMLDVRVTYTRQVIVPHHQLVVLVGETTTSGVARLTNSLGFR